MSAVLEFPQRHAVSVQEYLRMGEAGVFASDARLELIEGEIVERAPIGSRHAGMVNTLIWLFSRAAGDRAVVAAQNPLIAGDRSVPQPDVVLLRPRADRYSRSHPTPADVLLLVEVAESTLPFDLGTKVPLYSRCGIAEAWVIDVQERVVHVFRDPSPSGYRTSFTLKGDEKVTALALPAIVVPVAELFPA